MAGAASPLSLTSEPGETLTSDPAPMLTSNPLQTYIGIAEDFIGRCEKIQVHGIHKLKKKCLAELKFLQSLKTRVKVDSHLNSSNLGHFSAVLHCVENLPDPTSVLKPFMFPGRDSLPVDVIACQGHLWVKVIARKAQALHLVWAGQGQFGEKTLLDQARDYLHLSTLNPVNFRAPKVCYAFYSGVTKPMAAALRNLGILVFGELLDVSLDIQTKLSAVNDLDLDSSSDLDLDLNNDLDLDSDDDNEDPDLRVPPLVDSIFLDDSHRISGHTVAAVGSESNNGQQSSCDSKKDVEDKLGKSQICEMSQQSQTLITAWNSSNCVGNESIKPRPESVLSEQNRTAVEPEDIEHSAVGNADQLETTCTNTDSKLGLKRYYFFDGDIMSNKLRNLFQEDVEQISESLSQGGQSMVPTFDTSPVKKVNLDVTALIVLVSAVTHGGCHFVFEEDILSQQAAEERWCPVLPKIKEFLKGKELFACQSAVTAFTTILHTLGGLSESARAAELMGQVTVVPDRPSSRTQELPTSAKIKERSKVIFGTGDELRMVTLTANSGFVRAAKNQGVDYAVFIHAARALTEAKEPGARKLGQETGDAIS